MQISFDGQKHIFWQVLLWLRPILGWHKHQRCTVAKCHDYGHLLYVLFLQPYKLNIHIYTPRAPGARFTKLFMTELIHKT